MNNETANEIEFRIAHYFGIREHLIVPNVTSWVVWDRECDLIVLSASDYAYEIEIKISKSDLLKDKKKWHNHESDKLRKLWFAIPEKMISCIEYIPERAGILVVNRTGNVRELRKPIINNSARKLTAEEKFNLARLGALRMWKLKWNEIIKEKS